MSEDRGPRWMRETLAHIAGVVESAPADSFCDLMLKRAVVDLAEVVAALVPLTTSTDDEVAA